MMVQETKLICDKCHKEAKSLKGSLGGGLFCEKCYVPFEQRENFDYIPEGKTGGRIKVPEAICGICGHYIRQPTPVNIWTHGKDAEDEGMEYERDHVPRIATLLELLIIQNKNEDRIQPIGHWHYYGKSSNPVHKDRYVQCLIHRKYWLETAKLPKDQRIAGYNPYHRKLSDAVKDFIFWSQRANAKQFTEFLTNNRIKKLKKNPKSTTHKQQFPNEVKQE